METKIIEDINTRLKKDNKELLVLMPFGSRLYGTQTEQSDYDYKGIFIPSCYEICINKIPKSLTFSTNPQNIKNSDTDYEYELYSIHYFIELALAGQTVALDMLHASDYIYTSSIWDSLRIHKNLFYTKNMKSFIGYAQHQAAKYGLKGSRLSTIKTIINFFQNYDDTTKLKIIWDKLPTLKHIRFDFCEKSQLNQYVVCGKKFSETTEIRYILPSLKRYQEEFGARAKAAEENKGIDWKAISHAFRAAYQTLHIFKDGSFSYPLPETDFMISIKKGEITYKEAQTKLEKLINDIEELSNLSSLPLKPLVKSWYEYLYKIIYSRLMENNQSK